MMRKLLIAGVLASAVTIPAIAAAPPFDTSARVAYMIDLSSGATLYAKDADVRMPPASMAKMMTVHIAFNLIKKGDLKVRARLDLSNPLEYKIDSEERKPLQWELPPGVSLTKETQDQANWKYTIKERDR